MDNLEQEQKEYYSIKQAAEILGVESYLLRYWEDELGLKILRTETGRRIYHNEDINKFKEIIEYRKAGGKLKNLKCESQGKDTNIIQVDLLDKKNDSIKMKQEEMMHSKETSRNKYIVNKKQASIGIEVEKPLRIYQDQNTNEKMLKLQELLSKAFTQALEESTKTVLEKVNHEVKDTVSKELDYQFRMREERDAEVELKRLKKEEEWIKSQEEHFRMLDELLRSGNNHVTIKKKKMGKRTS